MTTFSATTSLLSLAFVLVMVPGAEAESRTFVPPHHDVFVALELTPSEFPDQAGRFKDHVATRCATTDESLKSVKKRWRKAVRAGTLEEHIDWDGGWWRKMDSDLFVVFAVHRNTPIEVAFDETSGAVMVSWPEGFPGCHEEFDVTWFGRTDDVSFPERKNSISPEYPEKARERGASGAVLGSFLLGENGKVIDVCIVAVHPPGIGFEEASVEAERAGAYEGLEFHDRSESLAFGFLHKYWLGMDSAPISAVVESYFEHTRLAKSDGS